MTIWLPEDLRSSMLLRLNLETVSLLQVTVSLSSACDGSSSVSFAGRLAFSLLTCSAASLPVPLPLLT
jgi:hypothetical protein